MSRKSKLPELPCEKCGHDCSDEPMVFCEKTGLYLCYDCAYPRTTWKDTVENPKWVEKRLKQLAAIRNETWVDDNGKTRARIDHPRFIRGKV